MNAKKISSIRQWLLAGAALSIPATAAMAESYFTVKESAESTSMSVSALNNTLQKMDSSEGLTEAQNGLESKMHELVKMHDDYELNVMSKDLFDIYSKIKNDPVEYEKFETKASEINQYITTKYPLVIEFIKEYSSSTEEQDLLVKKLKTFQNSDAQLEIFAVAGVVIAIGAVVFTHAAIGFNVVIGLTVGYKVAAASSLAVATSSKVTTR